MARRKKESERGGHETREGYVSATTSERNLPDYVVVELRYESPVAFTATRFAAPAAAAPQADSLNNVLAKYDIASMGSQFNLKSREIGTRIEVAATLPPRPSPEAFTEKGMDTQFIQSGFVQVVPKKSGDAEKIAHELGRRKAVWTAYVAPRPVPATPAGSAAGSRNFESAQGYLYAAPDGVGAADVGPWQKRKAAASRSVTSRATGTAGTRTCQEESG